MGRGEWIETTVYAEIMSTEKSFPKIVKRFSLHKFGKENLINSTISGKISNRSKNVNQSFSALSSSKLLAITGILLLISFTYV